MIDLSIVVPVFNEEKVLPEFYGRLTSVLKEINLEYEVIFVDDGSVDGSTSFIHHLRNLDKSIALLALSRNFGKDCALTAGLDHCQGEAVVIIDADLQDPPELIPKLLEKWKQGFDIVYATRVKRIKESALKIKTASGFYRLMQALTPFHFPLDAGDYRLLSKKSVNAIRQCGENQRFMKGIFAWIGFPSASVEYVRQARYLGSSKWNYRKLFSYAIDGITSFSTIPLKMSTYVGIFTACTGFLYALFVIYKTIFIGEDVAGYPSLMVVILVLGGIQLTSLGIIGEYLGRTYLESKNRPAYFLKGYFPAKFADDEIFIASEVHVKN